MLRSTLIGVVALGMMAGAATAQTKMDCSKLYKDFWEKFDRRSTPRFRPSSCRA